MVSLLKYPASAAGAAKAAAEALHPADTSLLSARSFSVFLGLPFVGGKSDAGVFLLFPPPLLHLHFDSYLVYVIREMRHFTWHLRSEALTLRK